MKIINNEKIKVPEEILTLVSCIYFDLFLEGSTRYSDEAERFLSKFNAIALKNIDMSKIWSQFAYWLLINKKCGALQIPSHPYFKNMIRNVAILYKCRIKREDYGWHGQMIRDYSENWEHLWRKLQSYSHSHVDAAIATFLITNTFDHLRSQNRRYLYEHCEFSHEACRIQARKLLSLLAKAPIIK